MRNIYGYWGTIKEVSGDRALFEFTHSSEPGHKQRMWIPAVDAGIAPKPKLSPIVYDGGGAVNACHPCGNAIEECECG